MEICQNGERTFSIGGVDLGADVTGGTGDMDVLDAGERASGRIDLLPELAEAVPCGLQSQLDRVRHVQRCQIAHECLDLRIDIQGGLRLWLVRV
ncbi:MAG: hypothetical protein P8M28_06210 [Alphaproteobacteria bacterium]|nr:hypothetical protein [Alphaproteobacteria bacterium]